VTDEHPNEKMKQQYFEPPLDESDGMARVLDPVSLKKYAILIFSRYFEE
jgi:hypothetical protein